MDTVRASAGPDHPFGAVMSHAKSATEEFTKMFTDLRVPGADVWMAGYRRNIEAMAAAHRIAVEGAQAVAKRQMEIMQHAVAEFSDAMRAIGSAEGPQAKAARQAELLKQAYERAIANTNELGELIRHANGEAIALLNKRFAEAMDEVKTLVDKTG
jgi:phasin family protein